MNRYFSIIKADYLQRFRSYTFAITLIVSVIIAYKFVPSPADNYTTVRVNDFVGFSNAAWIGHSTAIISSMFLWLIGFYLINNGLRRDRETGVGQIIATTSISNFQYLVAKALSNFLVLSTIAGIVFLMALGLVLVRGSDYEFNVVQFVTPYLFTTLPTLVFLAAFTVLFEVLFGRRTNLMNVSFFFVLIAITGISNTSLNQLHWIDPLGVKYLSNEIRAAAQALFPNETLRVGMGIHYNVNRKVEYFLFEGSAFRLPYFISRMAWVAMGFVVLKLGAVFFNRFDSKPIIIKKRFNKPQKSIESEIQTEVIKIEGLIKSEKYFGIYPLIKAEFMMLVREGPAWFWLINLGGSVSLLFVPLELALKIMLPILWFLQVNRWADIATKEQFFRTDTFIYSTFKPLQRLLVSQIIAAILLAIGLALPLIFRLLFETQFLESVQVVLGAVVLVSFSVFSGILFGGKRFFEITFFMLTYAIVSGVNMLNYAGGYFPSSTHIMLQFLISCFFLITAFSIRNYRIKKL